MMQAPGQSTRSVANAVAQENARVPYRRALNNNNYYNNARVPYRRALKDY